MEYKPLDNFLFQTDELKKLISEHPDYPIVVLCGTEVVAGDDYNYWYAPNLRFSIGEILDCDQDIHEEKIFADRDDFAEAVFYKCEDEYLYEDLSDKQFDKIVADTIAKYDPYWRKVIAITADV